MPDEAETEGNMGVFLRAALENPARGGLPRGPLAAAGACLLHWGPTWLYNLVWRCTSGASPFPRTPWATPLPHIPWAVYGEITLHNRQQQTYCVESEG